MRAGEPSINAIEHIIVGRRGACVGGQSCHWLELAVGPEQPLVLMTEAWQSILRPCQNKCMDVKGMVLNVPRWY